jgi:hypothetical protein
MIVSTNAQREGNTLTSSHVRNRSSLDEIVRIGVGGARENDRYFCVARYAFCAICVGTVVAELAVASKADGRCGAIQNSDRCANEPQRSLHAQLSCEYDVDAQRPPSQLLTNSDAHGRM